MNQFGLLFIVINWRDLHFQQSKIPKPKSSNKRNVSKISTGTEFHVILYNYKLKLWCLLPPCLENTHTECVLRQNKSSCTTDTQNICRAMINRPTLICQRQSGGFSQENLHKKKRKRKKAGNRWESKIVVFVAHSQFLFPDTASSS